ncbi:MAG: methionine gamma-lyase family protein [Firmicutes bacterium]|nr:methionine gamma-lyase family protein [Bacillota bacterium]
MTHKTIAPEIRLKWRLVEDIVQENTARVVDAFRQSGLSAVDLLGSTGYGYDDRGRNILDQIVATIFGGDRALLRPQWASGTHALATVLKAVTRAYSTLWIMSGPPYDTLGPVLTRLRDRHVIVQIVPLVDNMPNLAQLDAKPGDVVYVQRSRGYSERPSWGEGPIRRVSEAAHAHGAILVVDNCYGEFTQTREPGHWGADLVVGSLMKNPGGTIAPTGAYVAGREPWVSLVADELFAPGIGGEVGATYPYLRLFAQGLFLAPQLVGEAVQGGIYASFRAREFDIVSYPGPDDEERNDIVVALELGSAERVIKFCRVVQSWSPVDAQVEPQPWNMPGYQHPIIMAAGGFVAGGSLELSADAPIRPPYRVFLQGGVNRWHTKLVVDEALEALGLEVSN